MSLILEALNKADRNREPSEFFEISALGTPRVAQASAVPLWALAAGLSLMAIIAIAAIVVVWHLLVRAPLADTTVKAPTEQSLVSLSAPAAVFQEAPASAVRPLRNTQVAADVPPVAPAISEMYARVKEGSSDLYRQAAEAQVAEVQAAEAALAQVVGAEDMPTAAVEGASRSAAQVELPSAEEIQRMWQETAPEPVTTTVQPQDPYSQAPYLHQLPKSFQSRIPTLLYQNHIYSATASGVIINGKTYRAGDVIAPDLVVLSVAEDDLVLSYLQRPFKLAALSSWVQLE